MDFVAAFFLSRITKLVVGPELDIEPDEGDQPVMGTLPPKTTYDPSDDPEAHETAAVLRMHRADWPVPKICEVLKMSKQQLAHELQVAVDDEVEAHARGMKIYDGIG